MPKFVERKLLCDLTDEEVTSKAAELAIAIAEIDRVEGLRAEAAKDFRDQLTELRERMRQISEQVSSRTEFRLVRCAVEMHTPQVGFKRLTRLDTGELIQEVPMTDAERDQRLFAEPDAEQPPAAAQGDEQGDQR